MYSKNRISGLKGGALYYVIFVGFMMSALISFFIVLRSAKVAQVNHELEYYICVDDLNSALSLYLSDPENYQNNPTITIDLFEDTCRRVLITQKPYGLLDFIHAEISYRGKLLSKNLLVGKNPFKSDSVALYVPDYNQILYASGNTLITGNVMVPVDGIQHAAIEGRPLRTDHVVNGTVSHSNDSLPPLAPAILKKLMLIRDLDSLCYHANPISKLYQSSLENPMDGSIQWFGAVKDYQISDFEARGGIGFCSSGTILIKKDASLHGSIVIASRIIVEDNFEGEVQLIARDSLIIGKACHLRFPSLACLYSNNVSNLELEIGCHSLVEGTILVYQSGLALKKPFLKVGEGAVIKGQVYHRGMVNLLGSVYGSLYCESFYLKTDRAQYENHLLDNEIDFMKLPPFFVAIDLIHGYHDQAIDVIDYQL